MKLGNDRIFFKSFVLDMIAAVGITMDAYFSLRHYASLMNPYLIMWFVMALCYPVGKVFQYHLVGPRLVRWYLADIGYTAWYPLAAAAALATIELGLGGPFAVAWWVAVVMTIIGVVLEIIEMKFKAGGEWKDVMIFCATFVLVLFFLGHLTLSGQALAK
jgi:hypothetical protein